MVLLNACSGLKGTKRSTNSNDLSFTTGCTVGAIGFPCLWNQTVTSPASNWTRPEKWQWKMEGTGNWHKEPKLVWSKYDQPSWEMHPKALIIRIPLKSMEVFPAKEVGVDLMLFVPFPPTFVWAAAMKGFSSLHNALVVCYLVGQPVWAGADSAFTPVCFILVQFYPGYFRVNSIPDWVKLLQGSDPHALSDPFSAVLKADYTGVHMSSVWALFWEVIHTLCEGPVHLLLWPRDLWGQQAKGLTNTTYWYWLLWAKTGAVVRQVMLYHHTSSSQTQRQAERER